MKGAEQRVRAGEVEWEEMNDTQRRKTDREQTVSG